MLDFSFATDGQPTQAQNLAYAGGIEEVEFGLAKELRIIESHLDYYGKFRWSSQQVRQKRMLLTPPIEAIVPGLASILKQAFAGECGLVAIGD